MADENEKKEPSGEADESKKKPDEGGDMDLEIESPEQSRIAEHIGGKVQEIVQESDEPESDEEEFPEFEEGGSFLSQIRRILASLGITLKKVFSCLFIVIVGGALFYFLLTGGLQKIRDYFHNRGSSSPAPQSQTDESNQKPTPPKGDFFRQVGIAPSLLVGNKRGLKIRTTPSPIQTAYLFGNEENFYEFLAPLQDIVETNLRSGFRGQSQEKLARYINILGQDQNALNTDVYALLNATSDRSGALDRYIGELNDLLAVSTQASGYIAAEMSTASQSYSAYTDVKNQNETNFFQAVGNFHGEQGVEFFNEFVKNSQQAIDQRTTALALNKLGIIYGSAIAKLTARISDIQANRQALIDGVRVYDFANSDLNIILPESAAPGSLK